MTKGKYFSVAGLKIYCIIKGKGPTIALLHPSPHTSDMLLPLADKLAKNYTVICIDTPGYGRSDKLNVAPKDISFYSDILYELFKQININKIAIYGSATGAQIGIRFALDYPKMVSQLFLDNAAHFDDDLRNNILENYFPDLTPVKDGSHLKVLWDIVSNLFMYFPWCFKTPEFALNRPQLPASVLHAIVIDFLKAGKDYDLAYKVAFMHEKAEHVQNLKVPTSIFKWKGSIILPYVNDLVAHEFASNIETIDLEKDPTERTEAMVAHIIQKSKGFSDYKFSSSKGEDYVENKMHALDIKLPEATVDGTYLLIAWNLICEQKNTASAEETQQLLINGYTNRTN